MLLQRKRVRVPLAASVKQHGETHTAERRDLGAGGAVTGQLAPTDGLSAQPLKARRAAQLPHKHAMSCVRTSYARRNRFDDGSKLAQEVPRHHAAPSCLESARRRGARHQACGIRSKRQIWHRLVAGASRGCDSPRNKHARRACKHVALPTAATGRASSGAVKRRGCAARDNVRFAFLHHGCTLQQKAATREHHAALQRCAMQAHPEQLRHMLHRRRGVFNRGCAWVRQSAGTWR